MARDTKALERELAADFSLPGKPEQTRGDFLRAIALMPYRILDVGGEDLPGSKSPRAKSLSRERLLPICSSARATPGGCVTPSVSSSPM